MTVFEECLELYSCIGELTTDCKTAVVSLFPYKHSYKVLASMPPLQTLTEDGVASAI
jgi:hypothetical protein